jgi:hypothetical protein
MKENFKGKSLNIKQLKEHIPEIFAEDRLDWEKLKAGHELTSKVQYVIVRQSLSRACRRAYHDTIGSNFDQVKIIQHSKILNEEDLAVLTENGIGNSLSLTEEQIWENVKKIQQSNGIVNFLNHKKRKETLYARNEIIKD